jgi:beta-N-acetylhexosaminidase
VRKQIRILLLSFSLLLLWAAAPPRGSLAAPASQGSSPEARAQALLDSLTPAERVGQLFLINFSGRDTSAESEIYDLLATRRIGGVILRADHDNFTGPENTPAAASELIHNLQRAAWLGSQQTITDTLSGELYQPTFIPLFVGISQNGDGAPNDQILEGLTRLPSQMGIGATWQPELAHQAGAIAGRELAALGFNFLLGPSLDVVENPSPESQSDLGTATFGGDPFWVAQMGSAYVQGVHEGSGSQLLVVGKHFPGVGSADRPLADEVSTVRKSLEQLKQYELAPFFQLTGDAPSPEATLDGLLISHIRYQGFLGNIRATTRPVSFDEASFALIMSLEPFAAWRQGNGLMITDDLGTRAVRRFYDPTGLAFNARLVVRDAFLAGNDLLYLGDIVDTGDTSNYETILSVLDFFTQKYTEDLAFAQRVDESLLRILTRKAALYPSFALNQVTQDNSGLDTLSGDPETVLDIARRGATLISPDAAALDTVLPDAPGLEDRIVFLTDSITVAQCSTCTPTASIASTALEQAVIRLYGPEGGNQIQRRNLASFTFADLRQMLDGAANATLESSLRSAGWIVVLMNDIHPARPDSLAFRRLLAERDDLLRGGKRVIVFAFGAPYLLDATEISKITAYYGIYSTNPQTIDLAASILFKEFIPNLGALPVSVAGIGYDLISATSPDPLQTITIQVDGLDIPPETGVDGTPEPTVTPAVELGDTLTLVTQTILDHNGNPVPDGTPVQFTFNVNAVETTSPIITTIAGIAQTQFTISEPGIIQIGLRTEPLALVAPLVINIPIPEDFVTPLPITETPTPEPTALPSPTATALPTPLPPPPAEPPRAQTDLVDWFIAFVVSVLAALAALRFGMMAGQVRWSLRWALSAGLGGLLTYLYLALGFPGAAAVVLGGRGAVLWVTLAGAGIGWLAGLGWRLYTNFAAAHHADSTGQ